MDDETTQINFDITVNAGAPTGLTLSVNPATVTESADATTITLTATLVGGTFAENRNVLFVFSSTATDSTATVDIDYTRVSSITTITIPANMASGTATFPFTALVDTVAEPAGETVVIEAGVLILNGVVDLDTSIPVTTATLTINDPPATVPTGITLSVDPAAVPESADPTTITVTATVVGGTFAVDRRRFVSGTAAPRPRTLTTRRCPRPTSPSPRIWQAPARPSRSRRPWIRSPNRPARP